MTLKKLLGHNERTGLSDTSIIFCAFLTGAGISALGISLCLLMQWAVLNGYVLFRSSANERQSHHHRAAILSWRRCFEGCSGRKT